MEVTHTAMFKGVSVTVQQDLFEVKGGANCTSRVHGWVISQESEIGDAQEEMLRITANRGTTSMSSGSGGTTLTAQPRRNGDPVWNGTVEANNTTILSGSPDQTVQLEVYAWNERATPMIFWYTPEARPLILANEYWTLRLETTPADAVTMSGTLFLEQV